MALAPPRPAAAAPLTFEECRRQAGQHNAQLLAAQASRRAAEALARAAWSGFLPQLGGSFSYSYSNNPSSGSATEGNSDDENRSFYSASLTASQNLFNGFQDRGKVEQALANERLAAAKLEIASAQLLYDLNRSFMGLAFAQGFVGLTRQIAERRQENLHLVELRFENGSENKGSLLLSRANLGQAKLDELAAAHAILESQQQLAQVLGREDGSPLAVDGEPPTAAPDRQTDLAQKVRQTPLHRQAEAQEEASRAVKGVALSPFLPTLAAQGALSRSGDTFFPDKGRWSVGLSLNWSLLSGGKDYFGLKSASAALVAATYNRLEQDRQLLSQLRQALNNYVEAVERLKVDEGFRDATALRSEIARSKYNNGLLSFEDWDIIESDLINRQKSALQSRRDRVVAEAAYRQVLGQGVVP